MVFPCCTIPEKDGTFRFCVDMRAVNSVTKGLAHPLPRVDDALDSLAGARWYTTLDMATGYWQVGIAPEDREKTAFSTGRGLHQFRVMAMGLKNAGGTFQRLMELVLAGLDTQTCLVYLDDIILFSRTEDEHLKTLRDVFERIRGAGLKLKPQKCHIARNEVTFLGHSVSEKGVLPDRRNVEKVLTWPEPSTDAEMNSFLGLCGYYANFIEGYADIARPLRTAAASPGKLTWTDEMRDAFSKLKEILASPPVLSLPRFEGVYVLYTDASNTAVGSVLTERINDEEHVIAYDSKVLTKQQIKWPTYDKELWAVVHAIRRFRQYTTGSKFLIVTDHKPLANIPQSIVAERDGTGRRGRWAIELSSFEFGVVTKAGVDHGNADALSRRPTEPTKADEPSPALPPDLSPAAPTHAGVTPGEEKTAAAPHVLTNRSRVCDGDTGVCPDPDRSMGDDAHVVTSTTADGDTRDIRQAQEEDCCLRRMRGWLENKEAPDPTKMGEWTKVLAPRWDHVSVMNGLVGITSKGDFRTAVPKELRQDIIRMAHDHPTSGHMGRRRTSFRVRQRFIWPGMYADVRAFCEGCTLCQRRHRPSPAKRAPMVTEMTSKPFQRIALDITEMPMSAKGNKYALVIMDYFSKYVRIYPMADQTTETILDCLLDWVHDFGVPNRLHSDQGRQFESRMFQAMCERLGIKKTRTTPYHPESDGMVERFNRTLKDMISKYVDGEGLSWDTDVKAYSMAYNSSVHSATGYTPYFLVHGYEPRMPLDVAYGPTIESVPVRSYLTDRLRAIRAAYQRVKRNSARSAAEASRRYNKKENAEAYRVGDEVWVRDFRAAAGGKPKLGLPFKGPATIIGKVGPPGREVTYEIANKEGKIQVVHHNHLKPVTPSVLGRPTSGSNDSSESTVSLPSEAEKIPVSPPTSHSGPSDIQKSLDLLILSQPTQLPRNQDPTARSADDVGVSEDSAVTYGPAAPYITRSGRVSRPVVPYQAPTDSLS